MQSERELCVVGLVLRTPLAVARSETAAGGSCRLSHFWPGESPACVTRSGCMWVGTWQFRISLTPYVSLRKRIHLPDELTARVVVVVIVVIIVVVVIVVITNFCVDIVEYKPVNIDLEI